VCLYLYFSVHECMPVDGDPIMVTRNHLLPRSYQLSKGYISEAGPGILCMMDKVGQKALPGGGLCEAAYEATSLHLRHLLGI